MEENTNTEKTASVAETDEFMELEAEMRDEANRIRKALLPCVSHAEIVEMATKKPENLTDRQKELMRIANMTEDERNEYRNGFVKSGEEKIARWRKAANGLRQLKMWKDDFCLYNADRIEQEYEFAKVIAEDIVAKKVG